VDIYRNANMPNSELINQEFFSDPGRNFASGREACGDLRGPAASHWTRPLLTVSTHVTGHDSPVDLRFSYLLLISRESNPE
jgi:hypothetical protein